MRRPLLNFFVKIAARADANNQRGPVNPWWQKNAIYGGETMHQKTPRLKAHRNYGGSLRPTHFFPAGSSDFSENRTLFCHKKIEYK